MQLIENEEQRRVKREERMKNEEQRRVKREERRVKEILPLGKIN